LLHRRYLRSRGPRSYGASFVPQSHSRRAVVALCRRFGAGAVRG